MTKISLFLTLICVGLFWPSTDATQSRSVRRRVAHSPSASAKVGPRRPPVSAPKVREKLVHPLTTHVRGRAVLVTKPGATVNPTQRGSTHVTSIAPPVQGGPPLLTTRMVRTTSAGTTSSSTTTATGGTTTTAGAITTTLTSGGSSSSGTSTTAATTASSTGASTATTTAATSTSSTATTTTAVSSTSSTATTSSSTVTSTTSTSTAATTTTSYCSSCFYPQYHGCTLGGPAVTCDGQCCGSPGATCKPAPNYPTCSSTGTTGCCKA